MIETIQKSLKQSCEPCTKYIQLFQTDYKGHIHSPAFQSLSFRGSRGYANNLIIKPKRIKQTIAVKQNTSNPEDLGKRPFRATTYGAILRFVSTTGQIKYALVQGRYTGKWSFPKGHSNEHEQPIECTLREVAEETGIDHLPEPAEYIQVGYGNYFVFSLKDQIPLIPRDTNEIMNTKWVTLEEMERMPLNADASLYRKRLKDVSVS